MELWVRSQDKRFLVRANALSCGRVGGIMGVFYEKGCLGEYKSEERCLEIIDEIQKILSSGSFLFLSDPHIDEYMREYLTPMKPIFCEGLGCDCKVEQLNSYVYEMPQE